ncbi:alpha/beta fold hydrolase [Stigmatella aurantiaca]|nr:alpha/beta hydrolase [Stigmatella aurantiaca]
MFQVSRTSARRNDYFHIANLASSSLKTLSQHIRDATGLQLEWIEELSKQDPIDTLLQARIAAFSCYLTQPRCFDNSHSHSIVVGNDLSPHDEDTRNEGNSFESFHQQWMDSRQRARRALTPALESLSRRMISAEDGSPIEYQAAGSGPVLLCINATGQDASVWRWFVAHFLNNHRLIYWSPRGTYGPPSRCPSLTSQCAELELILSQEEVQQCRIVAWCSGAKIAIELLNRRPIASAMVLVTGAFTPMKGLEHLETTFQRTLQQMCRMVNQRGETAALVKTAMVSMVTNNPAFTPDFPQGKPEDVLALASQELRTSIAKPFAHEESIRNYSSQVADYASHDISGMLKKVTVPTLLLGAELDQIVSPEASKMVSERLPAACFAELRGASHYCLYENAELIIELAERFFDSPRTFRPASPELARTSPAFAPADARPPQE